MAPPGLPFAVCGSDHHFAGVDASSLNLVATEAALAAEYNLNQRRILSKGAGLSQCG